MCVSLFLELPCVALMMCQRATNVTGIGLSENRCSKQERGLEWNGAKEICMSAVQSLNGARYWLQGCDHVSNRAR